MAKLAGMTLFLRAMILGYVAAASAAVWLSASGVALWAVLLLAWIGANMLGLAFTAIGVALWPAMPARDAEFRLWDEDLARELLDADLRNDLAPVVAPGQGARRREAG